VLLRLGDRAPDDGLGQRDGDRHAHGEARIEETERRRPAAADEEERADAQERRGQEAAEEVVDAEHLVAPAGGRSPGERGRRRGVGGERCGPGGELRPALVAPASEHEPGEPEGEECGGECKERFHGPRSVNLRAPGRRSATSSPPARLRSRRRSSPRRHSR
jgi:hypothetical protein